MSQSFQRALLLMGQNRNEQAADELGKHLGSEPNDPHAHALLALCLSESKRFEDATRHAEEAIRLLPDFAYAHYAAAHVFYDRHRLADALRAINEAIRLDPDDASHFALLAQIHLQESRHTEALAAAERGLEIDPEDVTCQNLRAMALKNLGRHSDAAEALAGALRRNPDNAITHANKGWALLEKNKSEEALQHFQEALRLDPSLDWAREGIVVALKSRYRIYAVMLKYFLWMSKLSSRAQWGVILGVYFGSRFLGQIADSNPGFAPYLLPLRILLGVFAILTWIADPLFNLALRLNKYGRLALTRDQVKGSNLVGTLLAISAAGVIAAFFTERGVFFLAIAIAAGLLALPGSTIFKCAEGWPRRIMLGYTSLLAAVAVLGISLLHITYDMTRIEAGAKLDIMRACMTGFVLGIFAATFVANFAVSWRPRR